MYTRICVWKGHLKNSGQQRLPLLSGKDTASSAFVKKEVCVHTHVRYYYSVIPLSHIRSLFFFYIYLLGR